MSFLKALCLIPIVFLLGCIVHQEENIEEENGYIPTEHNTEEKIFPWHAIALLKPGEHALWFELGEGSPVLIEAPESSSLNPFIPWPHAWHISGMLMWEDKLIMAVNRSGFLIFEIDENSTESGNVYLFSVWDSYWDLYTTESLFLYENKATVLLYRNDFFTNENAPPLREQLYILDRSSSIPLTTNIPALEIFPMNVSENESNWEAEALYRSSENDWYIRIREKDVERAETFFLHTDDLSEPGRRVSNDEWRSIISTSSIDNNFSPHVWLSILPHLPEDFVYTYAAQLGDVIVASWEEQQLPAIGAAGFMIFRPLQLDTD